MLQNIGDLKLLPIPKEKNILRDMVLNVKLHIVSPIVKHFTHNYDEAIKMLVTEQHVKFYFEVFAQSFQLPRSEYQIISMTLEIYRKFLFNGDNRPGPLIKNFPYFVKEIFSHFSFLFHYGKDLENPALKEYILLCNKILHIFLKVGRKKITIDNDTFVYLMRILLGITDTVVNKNGLKRLSYGTLKVLFEFWVCSMNCDQKIWGEFQNISKKWMENIAFVHQWSSITKALTLSVARHLYGETIGEECVKIHWKGLRKEDNPGIDNSLTELYLPVDYTYFLCYIIFFVTGNPNDIQNATNYQVAMAGLRDVAVIFAKIGNKANFELMKQKNLSLKYPPSGETVMDLCGNWLFQGCNRDVDYTNGKALAYETLCKVFCRMGGKKFSPRMLSLFYEHVMKGLKEDETKIKSAILLHTQEIFSLELEGVFIMIPTFMTTCEKILCGKSSSEYAPGLRFACITIISSLICVSNHFGDKVYKVLKLQIQRNFVKSLNDEKNEKNLQHILWNICVCVFEEIDNSKKVGSMFIHQMLKICQSYATHPNSQYTPRVFATLYDVLSSFSCIWEKLHKNDKTVVKDIVTILSTQLETQIKLLRSAPHAYYEFICKSYSCIAFYCVYAYKIIIEDDAMLGCVLKAAECGLGLDFKGSREVEKVYKSALYLINVLVVLGGNYPSLEKYNIFFSVVKDQVMLKDKKSVVTSDYIRHYSFLNKYLYTLVEQPVSVGKHGVTLIVRNEMGKFMYDCEHIIPEKEKVNVDLQELGYYTGSSSKGLLYHSKEDDNNDMLMKHKIDVTFKANDKNVSKVMKLMETTEALQEKKRESVLPKLNKLNLSVTEERTPDKYETENKFQMSRLLLSHLGFFHVGIKKFFQLVQSEEYTKFHTELDDIFPRECHQISVFYIKKGEDHPKKFFKSTKGSKGFVNFVKSLGWPIKVGETQHRFLGGLNPNGSECQIAPYYADFANETIFHVFTNLKKMEVRKRYLEKNRVNVIWSEHTRKFKQTVISTENNQVNIIVYPHSNGLYKIHLGKTSLQLIPVFGPLLNGMLISAHSLPRLITVTAVKASMALKNIDLRYVSPDKNRSMKIEKIASKLKRGITMDNLLATVFIPMSSANVGGITKSKSKTPGGK